MKHFVTFTVVIAIVAASACVVNYYAVFLPAQRIQQDHAQLHMEEAAIQEKNDRREKIEKRYHDCMMRIETSWGLEITFCEKNCKSYGLGCEEGSSELIGNMVVPNSKCPPLTHAQEKEIEQKRKEQQELCLKEMKAGMENLW